jgi:hypothetical protein
MREAQHTSLSSDDSRNHARSYDLDVSTGDPKRQRESGRRAAGPERHDDSIRRRQNPGLDLRHEFETRVDVTENSERRASPRR